MFLAFNVIPGFFLLILPLVSLLYFVLQVFRRPEFPEHSASGAMIPINMTPYVNVAKARRRRLGAFIAVASLAGCSAVAGSLGMARALSQEVRTVTPLEDILQCLIRLQIGLVAVSLLRGIEPLKTLGYRLRVLLLASLCVFLLAATLASLCISLLSSKLPTSLPSSFLLVFTASIVALLSYAYLRPSFANTSSTPGSTPDSSFSSCYSSYPPASLHESHLVELELCRTSLPLSAPDLVQDLPHPGNHIPLPSVAKPPSFLYFPSPPATPAPDLELSFRRRRNSVASFLCRIATDLHGTSPRKKQDALPVFLFISQLSGLLCASIELYLTIGTHSGLSQLEKGGGRTASMPSGVAVVFAAFFLVLSIVAISIALLVHITPISATSQRTESTSQSFSPLSLAYPAPILKKASHYRPHSQDRSTFTQHTQNRSSVATDHSRFQDPSNQQRHSTDFVTIPKHPYATINPHHHHLYPTPRSHLADFHVLEVDRLSPVPSNLYHKGDSISTVDTLSCSKGPTLKALMPKIRATIDQRLGRESEAPSVITTAPDDFCSLHDPFAAPNPVPSSLVVTFSDEAIIHDNEGTRGNRLSTWGNLPSIPTLPPGLQHPAKKQRRRPGNLKLPYKNCQSSADALAVDVEDALLSQRLWRRLESGKGWIGKSGGDQEASSPTKRSFRCLGLEIADGLGASIQRAAAGGRRGFPGPQGL